MWWDRIVVAAVVVVVVVGGGRRGGLGMIAGGSLVLLEEQLRGRGLCAETAILARCGDGEGGSSGRGSMGVVHSGYGGREVSSGPKRTRQVMACGKKAAGQVGQGA